MSDTESRTSRRQAIGQLAAGAAMAGMATSAQAQGARPDSTPADFVRLQKQLSNWGRWGADDQMGAVNLITPAKRKAAIATVKEGVSFSMARNAETKEAVDNPAPIVRKTTRTGASVAQDRHRQHQRHFLHLLSRHGAHPHGFAVPLCL